MANTINDYIELHRNTGFKWGSLDCINFVGKGINHVGHTFFEQKSDWQYDDERTAKKCLLKLYRKHDVRDLPSLLDKHYDRLPKFPVENCIVARPVDYDSTTGYLLGFVSGRHGVYVGEEGLLFIPLEPDLEMYWRFK